MSESIVSDDEIKKAFAYANFGGADRRELLVASVFKALIGYHCGHTITVIMQELGFIGSSIESPRVTVKGKKLLRESYKTIISSAG